MGLLGFLSCHQLIRFLCPPYIFVWPTSTSIRENTSSVPRPYVSTATVSDTTRDIHLQVIHCLLNKNCWKPQSSMTTPGPRPRFRNGESTLQAVSDCLRQCSRDRFCSWRQTRFAPRWLLLLLSHGNGSDENFVLFTAPRPVHFYAVQTDRLSVNRKNGVIPKKTKFPMKRRGLFPGDSSPICCSHYHAAMQIVHCIITTTLGRQDKLRNILSVLIFQTIEWGIWWPRKLASARRQCTINYPLCGHSGGTHCKSYYRHSITGKVSVKWCLRRTEVWSRLRLLTWWLCDGTKRSPADEVSLKEEDTCVAF